MDANAVVRDYHERTKHRFDQGRAYYAAGPETLDWSEQPNPFRTYQGAPRTQLPLIADTLTTPYTALYAQHAVAPQALNLQSIGILLELSFALSAWKEYGPDRWALRCNPSSGNLHPTEAYVIGAGVSGLADGVHHYASLDHALEQRCNVTFNKTPALWIGLTSIQWREAWKYGERAFRYCQLDLGHALGALRYAAAALGWTVDILDLTTDETAHLLGVDRAQDFGNAEREEAEVIVRINTNNAPVIETPDVNAGAWQGIANLLDPHPMYRWPVIDEVAVASRQPAKRSCITPASTATTTQQHQPTITLSAAQLFKQRRSAQGFDRAATMERERFYRMLDALLPRNALPWDMALTPRIHPALFVHRVQDIAPGIYILPRTPDAHTKLRDQLHYDFSWTTPESCPSDLPLYFLAEGDARAVQRTINCHQAIAADSAFTVALLAEFDATLNAGVWNYRRLFWEAGLLGQVLYLEAEAETFRGTGIGCFFDDACHEVLGLKDTTFQSMYHFTVGKPLVDTRIQTLPAYSR